MIELIKQRLKSKTYWAAVAGITLTWVEAQSGLILGWVPPDLKVYAALAFPIAMMTLREVTTTALSEK